MYGAILYNWIGLVKYYGSPKSPTPRQKNLVKFYSDRCDITRIKLKFVFGAVSEYTKNIKFLEDRSAHIHNIGDKLENILVSQCRKVLCDSEINELDEEKNLVRKSRDKLINIDLEQAKKLSDKEMFVGSEVEKELKALGLR